MLALLPTIMASTAHPFADPVRVFSDAELAKCGGKIRIPQLVWTPSRLLLIAQCRCWGWPVAKTGGCDHPSTVDTASPSLNDNMLYSRVISKASIDGHNWENFTVLSPTSHSHGMPIYDRITQAVILQYQYHPNESPELNSTLFQRISRDDGLTWEDARNITAEIKGCNPSIDEMQVISAGSKIQTKSGRLMFSGHTNGRHQGMACIWYSDDHGKTYSTWGPFKGDEASFAELHPAGHLLLNGRGLNFPWSPNRTDYFSDDGGTTWTSGGASTLLDNNLFGCEGALAAVPTTHGMPTLYFSEPVGSNRTNLVLRCSHDGGKTWPSALPVNGNGPAAYSALLPLWSKRDADGSSYKLLIMWEEYPNRGPPSSFLAQTVNVDWCLH